MVTKEHLKTLVSRRDELYKFLNISNRQEKADTLEKTTQSAGFWENPKKAEVILKQLSSLKIWLSLFFYALLLIII